MKENLDNITKISLELQGKIINVKSLIALSKVLLTKAVIVCSLMLYLPIFRLVNTLFPNILFTIN